MEIKIEIKRRGVDQTSLGQIPKKAWWANWRHILAFNSQPKPTHLVLWKRQRACVMMNLENVKRKWRERCDRHLMQALNSAQHVFYPKKEQSILHSPWHKQNGHLQKPKKLSLSHPPLKQLFFFQALLMLGKDRMMNVNGRRNNPMQGFSIYCTKICIIKEKKRK